MSSHGRIKDPTGIRSIKDWIVSESQPMIQKTRCTLSEERCPIWTKSRNWTEERSSTSSSRYLNGVELVNSRLDIGKIREISSDTHKEIEDVRRN